MYIVQYSYIVSLLAQQTLLVVPEYSLILLYSHLNAGGRGHLIKLLPPALQKQLEVSAIWWLAWTARCSLETELLLFDERRTASLLAECGRRLQVDSLDELARAGLCTLGDPGTFSAQADTAVHLQRRTSLLATLLFLRVLALETPHQYLDGVSRRLLGLPRESASAPDVSKKDNPPKPSPSKRETKAPPIESSAPTSRLSPSTLDSELASAKSGKRPHKSPFHKLLSFLSRSSRARPHLPPPTPLAYRSSAPGSFPSVRSELVGSASPLFEAAASASASDREANAHLNRMLAIYEGTSNGPLLLYDSTCLALQLLLPLLVPCLVELVQPKASCGSRTLSTLLRAIANHVIVKTVLGVLLANPSWLVELDDSLLLDSWLADAGVEERSAARCVLATLRECVRALQCTPSNAPESATPTEASKSQDAAKVPSPAPPAPNKQIGRVGFKLLRMSSSEPSTAAEDTSLAESLAIVPGEAPLDLNVADWFLSSWLHDEPDFSPSDQLSISSVSVSISSRIASRPSLSSVESTVSIYDPSLLSFHSSTPHLSMCKICFVFRTLPYPYPYRLKLCIIWVLQDVH